jgi:DNA-binding NarL/FixJ family response regulator
MTSMINTSAVEMQPIATQVLRILLVDDHDLVRQGLRSMLEGQPGWTICGEAATGHDAIDMARQLQPDVVVIDIHMPGMDGLQASREILVINPRIEIVVLTIDETKEAVQAAREVGARGIVMKSDAVRNLVAAVAALAGHEPFYTHKVSQILLQDPVASLGASRADPVKPTKREREVVVLVSEGLGNKQVAATLGISAKTVESHRRNVMHKLDLRSTADLVRYAVRNGLIRP